MFPLKNFFPFLLLFLCCVAASAAKNQDWSKNVSVDKSGTVLIEDIPQVAQRGSYCVPSSIEMILRYYGANNYRDNRLGSFFDSSRSKGTYLNEVVRAFSTEPLSSEFQLTHIYDLWDARPPFRAVMRLERKKLVKSYLDAVPRRRASKNDKIKMERSGDIETFDAMNPSIAKKAFPQCRQNLRNLLASATEICISAGLPISWWTFMNFDPESRSDGSHLRVICGYKKSGNVLTEILYRDSWGKKERVKSVSLDEAVVMTVRLFTITPRGAAIPKIPTFQPNFPTKKIRLSPEVFIEMVDFEVPMFPSVSGLRRESVIRIGKYEITQRQYQTVMGTNPSRFVGENRPVENVSWEEAAEFCRRLTQRERSVGNIAPNQAYALPTNEQWRKLFTDDALRIKENPDAYAWLRANSGGETHFVGEKKPSEWGVHDAHGNVSEWLREQRLPFGSNFTSEGIFSNVGIGYDRQRAETVGFRIVLVELDSLK